MYLLMIILHKPKLFFFHIHICESHHLSHRINVAMFLQFINETLRDFPTTEEFPNYFGQN